MRKPVNVTLCVFANEVIARTLQHKHAGGSQLMLRQAQAQVGSCAKRTSNPRSQATTTLPQYFHNLD